MMQRFCLFLIFALWGSCAVAGLPGSFHAEFTQTRQLPGFDQPLVSHGNVDFQRNGPLHWTVEQPYHYEFIMADGGAREILPDGTQRKLDPDKAPWLAVIQRVFRAALSGDRATLTQYFSIHQADGRVRLTPLAAPLNKQIAHIDVVGEALPQRITISEQGGGQIDIRFAHVTPTPSE